MSAHDDFQQEPAPKPKSSGSKVLLILGTIGGLCLLLCCGGGFFIYYKVKDAFSITTNAAEVKKQAEDVAHIDIPESYTPASGMRFSVAGVTMKMIIYQVGANNQGGLVLMEMNQPGADPKQVREQMLQQMRQQQSQGGGFNSNINAQSTETKIFKINGEQAEFDFIKGTRAGDATVMRQIVGTFPGKNGTVMFMLIIPDSDYDEETVVKMIMSIRVPGSEATTEVSGESETDEGMSEKEGEGAGEKEGEAEKTE